MQELRVALPGVQVLFAFLLTVPFTQRFQALTTFQERLYFAILLSTAMTTALLVAPTANHRLLFRKRDKEYIVLVAIATCSAATIFGWLWFVQPLRRRARLADDPKARGLPPGEG